MVGDFTYFQISKFYKMKNLFYILLSSVIILNSFTSNAQADADSIIMGASYANDIYYSMENGEVHSVDRKNWDIGFYTNAFSAGIITNDGNGVVVYTYQNSDTTGWDNIDTTGLTTGKALYNSLEEWEDGAFNRKSSGHPDYGWGKYNSITHDVIGDSIYIVIFADESAKKLWIQRKHSMGNTYYFKYANLDGTEEVTEVLEVNPYTDKNFVYYSLQNQEVLDREPAKETWDIVITKYMEEVMGTPYPVTGILNNIDVPANKYAPVNPNFNEWYSVPMDSTKTSIGYDWKYFDMGNLTYICEDSTIFFVQNMNQDVYKLVFSAFDYTIGKAVFTKTMVSSTDIDEITHMSGFYMYPNPANNYISVDIENTTNWEIITIADLSGKVIERYEITSQSQQLQLDGLRSGMYFVSLVSKNRTATQKLIIRNN